GPRRRRERHGAARAGPALARDLVRSGLIRDAPAPRAPPFLFIRAAGGFVGHGSCPRRQPVISPEVRPMLGYSHSTHKPLALGLWRRRVRRTRRVTASSPNRRATSAVL